MSSDPYCPNLYRYERYHTRAVKVGETSIGGDNPIRLQSMTTTDTMNTEATVAQSVRMIEAGCELVRITAPSKDEALNLGPIRDALRKLGYGTPLVADIHFTPNAAEIAAGIVEKVRVNPGNYADKKKFEEIEYTDESYTAELTRIRQRFTPLVLLCKQHGTAMRIGTNHGSLSDRILSRYGDTPRGMVESAMEFIRICRDLDFHELVISMKASNPQVMVQAYRMLVWQMMREGMNYPLHLGVTEAGDGLDGRIKSAVGIGALLEDGLGDTIRVSLTEEPEAEIPVAKMLADRYAKRTGSPVIFADEKPSVNPFEYERRHTHSVRDTGGRNVPRVIADLSGLTGITPASLFACGLHYSVPLDKWNILDQAADYIYCGKNPVEFEIPGTLGIIYEFETWQDRADQVRAFPLLTVEQYMKSADIETVHFVDLPVSLISQEVVEKLKSDQQVVAILESGHEHAMPDMRAAFFHLINQGCEVPVIIKRQFSGVDQDEFMLYASTDAGSLLLDGLGDGLWLNAHAPVSRQSINETAFGILQATRTRISKTEYISCPSCGRTLFDLQETTARIRSRTSHLKGVKIGIMGCIVNGPGEMADADYGYVGTGVGKITLYKEKEVVKRNIPEDQAVDELITLIREHGDWVDPVTN